MNYAPLLIGIGGFFGAMARLALTRWFDKKWPSTIPIGTLIINLSGSLLLGFLFAKGGGSAVYLLFGVGFMGAYTTFSSFNVENVQLAKRREWKALVLYVAISYAMGIFFALLGFWIGSVSIFN